MLTNDFEYANDEFARQMGCSVEEYSRLPRNVKTNIIFSEDRKKFRITMSCGNTTALKPYFTLITGY